MTASSYDEALRRVLVHEGGWSDHPADSGGATMKGVTQRVYDGWRRRTGKAVRSVRNINETELRAIYRIQYWDAIRGDELPSGVDYATFDGAVNSGPSQAVKWLQRSLGVKADGEVGNVTLAAAKANSDHDALIGNMLDRRLAMLRGLRTWKTFGAGWTTRVKNVLAHAQAAASGSVGPEPAPNKAGSEKATTADRSLTDIAKTPEGLSTIGGVVTAVITAASSPGPLQVALAVALIIGVGVAAYYFIRRLRSADA